VEEFIKNIMSSLILVPEDEHCFEMVFFPSIFVVIMLKLFFK